MNLLESENLKSMQLLPDVITNYEDVSGESLLIDFLKNLNNENTRKQYTIAIREWFNFLCIKNELDKVTLKDLKVHFRVANEYIAPFRKQRELEEIKSSTFNAKIKGVRTFYNYLKTQTTSIDASTAYIFHNPFEKITLLDEEDSEGSLALEPDEVLLMLNNPYGNTPELKERNLLILELALTTGLRNGTLLSLKIDEITKVNDMYLIDKLTKRHKETMKPISDYYDRIIAWYNNDVKNRARDNGTIFNLHPTSANDMIKKWVSAVGITKKITFHGLRATCAILIFHTTGENKYRVQKFLDHSNEKVTDRYLDKELKIDHSGENAINNLKNGLSIREKLSQYSSELILDAICSMNIGVGLDIERYCKNNLK